MYALAPKRDGGFLKDISIKMKYKNGKISIQRHGDEEQYVVNRGVAELRLYKTNGWTKESEAYLYFTKVRDATPELTAQIKNAEVWRK